MRENVWNMVYSLENRHNNDNYNNSDNDNDRTLWQ